MLLHCTGAFLLSLYLGSMNKARVDKTSIRESRGLGMEMPWKFFVLQLVNRLMSIVNGNCTSPLLFNSASINPPSQLVISYLFPLRLILLASAALLLASAALLRRLWLCCFLFSACYGWLLLFLALGAQSLLACC